MKPDRLNAFTDGVIAIIITIMVLEIRVPEAGTAEAIRPVLPLLGAYALSFVNIGIFWSNHHHMFQSVRRVNGAVLWANLAPALLAEPHSVRDPLDRRSRSDGAGRSQPTAWCW